ncbi:thermonuclease family protein [Nitrosomonas supralitoralis]|uniref:Nuclease n=1 Tax=Nitrosomonas supralitoralis TaxID=2116706 RepID=A0A2P7NRL5_9PROT|nr:thermonuclease family protein [Nitrosomonas supralitoralis]PSJ16078.1 nuclease [Nitrosomonas supralitoralis]
MKLAKLAVVLLIMTVIVGCDSPVYADETIKPGSIVRVYDGDTFTINIDGDCPSILCSKIPVRINGIDAPELRGKCEQEKIGAMDSRAYLAHLLLNAKDVELRNIHRDKYFRINAAVFADGVDVGADMISKGLARPYSGGKRNGWCNTG